MFKIKHINHNGSFSVKLNRPVSKDDIAQLALIAHNLLTDEAAKPKSQVQEIQPGDNLTPEQSRDLLDHMRNLSNRKLGQKPVDTINMGTYKEPGFAPNEGYRIRMLAFPHDTWDHPKKYMESIKAYRAATNISIAGCKELVSGNHPGPLFTLTMAERVMVAFRALEVYAKIVPASEGLDSEPDNDYNVVMVGRV